MATEVQIHNCFIYLYNKNISDHVQIEGTGPISMILDIEGHSNI